MKAVGIRMRVVILEVLVHSLLLVISVKGEVGSYSERVRARNRAARLGKALPS